MTDGSLKKYLREALNEPAEPQKLEETIKLCAAIIGERTALKAENRTGFWRFLSDVFRFEGAGILGAQIITMVVVCFGISARAEIPGAISAFMPLFALAAVPILFRAQAHGMGEMEAVTRASGAQIILAKLILTGAADLICLTVLLLFEVSLRDSYEGIGQIVLYALVPYLLCMVLLLRCARLRRKRNVAAGVLVTLGSCGGWAALAKLFPPAYETSAAGVWIAAFVFFTVFFIKEVFFIVKSTKEGKLYGIIA